MAKKDTSARKDAPAEKDADAVKGGARKRGGKRRDDGESPAEAIARLEAKLEKKSAKLREIQAELRALGRSLDADLDSDAEAEAAADAGAAKKKAPAPTSPFAPAGFPDLPVVAGVTLAAVAAGVRYKDRLDVLLAKVEGMAGAAPSVAGVFTRSRTRAAPILWCEELLARLNGGADAPARIGLLVNAGNANAFTGDNGRRSAEETAKAAAVALGDRDMPVFVASTGVIGEPLPADRIVAKLAKLAAAQAPDAWAPAARAIMTTDTFAKAASAEITLGGAQARIVGIAKGSGMIAPDMATMLVFVFTDAAVEQKTLQKLTAEAADRTFNAITVDGDTSTSDCLLVAASGHAGNAPLVSARSEGYGAFRDALEAVFRELAQLVVKDGEGATKFVTVHVSGARTARAARRIGLSIANSPLVKTAWAGEDPNWGRIVMAVGKSGEDADRDALSIRYGPHPVAAKGWRAPDYDEATLAAYMKNPELDVSVDVGVGLAEATVWTCDLTHRYISINADYRS